MEEGRGSLFIVVHAHVTCQFHFLVRQSLKPDNFMMEKRIFLLFMLASHQAWALNESVQSFTICLRVMFTNFPEYKDQIVLVTRYVSFVCHLKDLLIQCD